MLKLEKNRWQGTRDIVEFDYKLYNLNKKSNLINDWFYSLTDSECIQYQEHFLNSVESEGYDCGLPDWELSELRRFISEN